VGVFLNRAIEARIANRLIGRYFGVGGATSARINSEENFNLSIIILIPEMQGAPKKTSGRSSSQVRPVARHFVCRKDSTPFLHSHGGVGYRSNHGTCARILTNAEQGVRSDEAVPAKFLTVALLGAILTLKTDPK
jgi:hypothetical protein